VVAVTTQNCLHLAAEELRFSAAAKRMTCAVQGADVAMKA
jgi:hypothetical protein